MRRPVIQRLGSGPDDAEPIKNHPFFQNVNWDDLLAKKVVPPYEPPLTSDDDVSQFDSKFTSIAPCDSPDDSFVSSSSNQFHGFTYVAPYSFDEFVRDNALSPVKSSFISKGPFRNITTRVIERDTSGEIYYFLEDSRGFPKLVNMVANDAKMVAQNDDNMALPPRFRQVLIESPL
ncbi:ribosomal protein S6 kinase beta-1 [Trichonephila clavipes]|nr:ribosomal protein S6 kinase beta-1 [Trichonephila clavipes]